MSALNKNTKGRDFNFFKKLSVTSADFQDNCDVVITFPTETILFNLEGSGVVEYSFNGNTTHGDMNSSLTSKDLKFEKRVVSKIWFKLISGGPVSVRIEAWGTYS